MFQFWRREKLLGNRREKTTSKSIVLSPLALFYVFSFNTVIAFIASRHLVSLKSSPRHLNDLWKRRRDENYVMREEEKGNGFIGANH